MTRKQEVMIVTENKRLRDELEVEKARSCVLEKQVITLQGITHSLLAQNDVLVGRLVEEAERQDHREQLLTKKPSGSV